MIIGLSGFARSGKDTFANRLVSAHGFTRIAFADTLRNFLYALNPIVHAKAGTEIYGHEDQEVVLWHLQEVIDIHTWDRYKESVFGPEIRRLLQRLGTEAGRQTLWDTIWIDAALKDLDPEKNYVVTDARFLNEFKAITDLGGTIVRIERPGVGPQSDHASETEALQYNFYNVIQNDGTIEGLNRKVDDLWFKFQYVPD